MAKRINGVKPQSQDNSKKILLGTAILWILFVLDLVFIAHSRLDVIVIVSIGTWAVGLLIAKPGDFGRKVAYYGLWNTLLGNTNKKGRPRKRN